MPLLTYVIFSPLVGIVLLLFIDKENHSLLKGAAFVTSIFTFILSLPLFLQFDVNTAYFQFTEVYEWIPHLGIKYHIGVDGISLLLIMLTTFLTALSILSSWTAIEKHVKEYMISFLFLEIGMVGVFSAIDLFLFYIFWEAMLIPMYFLIGIWGGPRRIYAAIKFFLYTMAGSVLMLVAILFLYFKGASSSFDYHHFITVSSSLSVQVQTWLFLAFALAFAIKVPMFPFHTWLPDAHVEAPTAGSVILAGVLLKMGTYGFIRFAIPLFPDAALRLTNLFLVLAVIGIIYGALVAMVQPDIKKLVAYSSVSHLGFVMLGLFSFNMIGFKGALIQNINHGLSTGALFLMVGMIYERRHTRLISDFGGLSKSVPIYAVLFMIVTLSSIGLPGLNGFVGEFLILLGAFKGGHHVMVVLAATGVILAAVYMLWMFQRVMFGKVTKPENENVADLNFREVFILVSIIIFIVWIGVYPQPFLETMDATLAPIVEKMQQAQDRLSPGNDTLKSQVQTMNVKGTDFKVVDSTLQSQVSSNSLNVREGAEI
ncbi:NADH-quinone oxidoreductase subunit M [candidate division CSSED10-310 bacterium]|uniref:NADH-quinone oxidoreductase subunit M n=1 Tax=candidate division CSSED10-310 bacterium TaxID=2855610 RepID=A0ABV6YY53_UNCC1